MMRLRCTLAIFCIGLLSVSASKGAAPEAVNRSDDFLRFADGTFSGWTVEGEDTWGLEKHPGTTVGSGAPNVYAASSLIVGGEERTGVLRSKPFKISKDTQKFHIAGADGTAAGKNDGDKNYILLRSYPDGEILRRQRPPGRTSGHS